MKNLVAGLILVLFCSCYSEKNSRSAASSGELADDFISTETVELTDEVSSWTLGLQTCSTIKDSLYPLIIYLHGGISTTRTDKGHDAHKMFHFISDSLPIFIASPSGNRDAVWWSSIGTQRILTSVDYMRAHYPIDPNKIFLAGVSDGATALFAIATIEDHPFAGFIGASGYPLYFEKQLNESISHLQRYPLKLYVSGNDRLYPTEDVISFYKILQEAHVPLQYTLYPAAEHGFDFKELERDTIIDLIHTWTL